MSIAPFFARFLPAFAIVILFLAAIGSPLMAEAPAAPSASSDDIGQYLADHQSDLTPFFQKNGDDIFRLAVPVLIEIVAWVIVCTMLVGWVMDVFLSRGFAYFFAPAFAEWKRCLIYATGRLFLSFVYTGLLFLAIVFSLKFIYAGIMMAIAAVVLIVVAFGAQLVWILYLYRTNFPVALVFYLAVAVVHSLFGLTMAKPLIGLRGAALATAFVDQAITPKMQADADAMKQQLAAFGTNGNSAKAKVADLQNQIAESQSDEKQLDDEIEQRKNSDIYVFSRIMQARARGDFDSARSQLVDFSAKFPSSSMIAQAQAQLAQLNDQIAAQNTQKQQEEAATARAAAQAQADLLARAAKGDATLSEMRRALIGKSRQEVSQLLGSPTDRSSDTWAYRQQMILNPLTNRKSGLLVYFSLGTVQGVDYNLGGGYQ